MIIALEGGICSGKTTLAKGFERQGFILIPEYMDIIKPEEEKKINNLSARHQSAINVFLDIEKRRKEKYQSYFNKKNVILDRSYLTLFAYEYAIGRDIKHTNTQDVITPDLIIFLDINDELRKQRSNDRQDIDMPEIFLNHDFNKKLKYFFLKQNHVPCIFLNTENLTPTQMINTLEALKINDMFHTKHLFTNKFKEHEF